MSIYTAYVYVYKCVYIKKGKLIRTKHKIGFRSASGENEMSNFIDKNSKKI